MKTELQTKIMTKSFTKGAVPVGLLMYLGVFHTNVLVILMLAAGLGFASFCIGVAIREEFGDLRD